MEYLNISNSIFYNNSGADSGGAVYLQNIFDFNKNTAFIINTNFTNNSVSKKGGGIYVFNQNIALNRSFFIFNDAGSGGAIFFETQGNYIFNILLENTTFESNFAFNEGGAIKSTYNLPILYNNSIYMSKNKALYGNNYASYPIRIAFKIYESINNSSNIR